jgi:RNA polymerase sigma factor (sigma-70 family)
MSDDDGHAHESSDEEAPDYLKTIRSVSSAKGLSRAEQEDIAQTSCVKMLKAEQRTKIENKEAYGATTARHARYDFLKQRKREGAVSYDDEQGEGARRELDRKAAEAENPIFRLLERLDAEKVFKKLPESIWDKFTEEDFELLRLRFEEDCSFEEIGQLMGKSTADARYHYQKLIARLRGRLRGHEREYFGDGGCPF